MAKSQIDDNKKLYESLKSIIDRTEAKINPEEIQDQDDKTDTYACD